MDDSGLIIDTTPEPRKVPLANSWLWVSEAFRLYRAHVGRWVLFSLALVITVFVLSVIPFVQIISAALMPFLFGAYVWAAHEQDATGAAPTLSGMVAAVRAHLRPLWVAGLLSMTGSILVLGITRFGLKWLAPGPDFEAALAAAGQTQKLPDFGGNGGWMALIMLFAFMLINSIFFFAPSLVVLRNSSGAAAMKASYLAYWKNWLPITASGLLLMALFFAGCMACVMMAALVGSQVGGVLLSLFMLLALPLFLLIYYTCYADIFSVPVPEATL